MHEQLTLENNSTEFTNNFIKIGVTKAKIANETPVTHISFTQHKEGNINYLYQATGPGDLSQPSSNLDFYIEDEVLHIAGKPDLGVTLVNNKPYVVTENFEGTLKDLEMENSNKDLALLLITLKEITTNNDVKLNT